MNVPQFPDFDILDPQVRNGTVIEASAGTGKTFSVAAFVARVIATDDSVRIGSILVTTFTRNAAAELRDRIRRRMVSLERQLRTGKVDEKDGLAADLAGTDAALRAERLARAVREFDTATITTIHSVCARILAMAGLPSVGDGDEADIDAVIDHVVNDTVITEAAAGHFYVPDRLRSVVEDRLAAPDAVLDFEPFKKASNGRSKEDLNAGLEHLVQVIESCVERIRSKTRLQPTFDDMLRRAAEVLADPRETALLAALRQRFTLAVIDEAQDTDKIQWSIFEKVFDEKSTTHTLLAVGDPKQAIYRFRGADVQAYLSVRRDDRRLTLRRNWRSDAGLLRALNHLFRGWEFGEGIDYVPVLPRDNAPETAITGAKPLTVIGLGAFDNKGRIVRPAARRVREILATVGIDKDGTMCPVRPKDICVLVTNKATGSAIEAELRDMGVSAVSSGTENVMKGEMAGAFARLFSAMDEPYDTSLIRLAAATPFFGEELADAGSLPEARIEEIQRDVNILASVLRRSGVAALAARLRSDAAVSGRIVQGDGAERRETDFAHVVELLHAATSGTGCTPAAVLQAVADLSAREDQAETVSRRVESDRDAVQIMTVHASKGLEFPVVVVADPWKLKRNSRGADAYHRPDPASPGRMQRVIDAGYVVERPSPAAKSGRVQEESDESKRLFYVAMTRARHHVSLVVAERTGSQWDGGVRATDGMSDPARFAEVSDVVEVVTGDSIRTFPRYSTGDGSADGLTAAPFGGSVAKSYERLSFSAIAKRREGRADAPAVVADDRSGAGHNDDDDDTIISVRSGHADPATPSGVDAMPLAALVGGTYFGKIMHAVYERVDFAAVDLTADVTRVVDTVVNGALLRAARDEIIHGVVLSLQTPLGGPFGGRMLSSVGLGDRLSELSFEMGLAAAADGVMVSDIGRVLTETLVSAGRADDILMPYARELASGSFGIPLMGLMNGSIDTLVRMRTDDADTLWVTDWKSNRLDEDGMDTLIEAYDRQGMLRAMEHHHYPLQALIYGTAVHRYVRSRTGAGKPAPRVAGLAYFFVRGMTGGSTPQDDAGNRHGVFTWEAPSGLWAALSDAMSAVTK